MITKSNRLKRDYLNSSGSQVSVFKSNYDESVSTLNILKDTMSAYVLNISEINNELAIQLQKRGACIGLGCSVIQSKINGLNSIKKDVEAKKSLLQLDIDTDIVFLKN